MENGSHSSGKANDGKPKTLERKHRHGYAKHPLIPDEFSVWEKEQRWGDWG